MGKSKGRQKGMKTFNPKTHKVVRKSGTSGNMMGRGF